MCVDENNARGECDKRGVVLWAWESCVTVARVAGESASLAWRVRCFARSTVSRSRNICSGLAIQLAYAEKNMEKGLFGGEVSGPTTAPADKGDAATSVPAARMLTGEGQAPAIAV